MTISLNDLNILESIVLEIKTHNYRMKQGSIPIALIYKIHYKRKYITKPSKEEYYKKKSFKPYNKYRKKAPITKSKNKKSFKELICYNYLEFLF